MKNMLVNLNPKPGNAFAADYAISVAAAFESRLFGVAFAYVPTLGRSVAHTTAARLLKEQGEANKLAAQVAADRFDAAARLAGLSAAARVFTTTLPGAPNLFGPLARRFDLSIVGQPEPNKIAPEDLIIEAALFDSGRPVIVIPYIHKDLLRLDRMMVCWDGSREAARALGDAMPLLRHARTVDVVVVTTERLKSDEIPGADVAQMLAHQGLKVELQRIGAAGTDVASVILNQASDTAADLIVMGAYGHPRLREFVLGGTTRAMLTSMTAPVLMSH
jgi:nucleotide-binding universal stress UspA family protein